MAEYKREMAVMATVGVVIAIVITGLAVSLLPGAGVTYSTTTTVATSEVSTLTSTSLPEGCSPSRGSGYASGTLVADSASPAIICVEFYWFNSTAELTPVTTSLVSIEGYTAGGPFGGNDGNPINGGSNFTVVASQSEIVLGGPTNANEGAVVAYSITAKSGVNATYALTLKGYLLGSDGPVNCSNGEFVHFNLVSGDGQPSYVYTGPSLCGGVSGTSTLEGFGVPGISYSIPSGFLCYRILSLTNSTQ